MPIDRALVRQRLAQLSDYLTELTSLSELDKAEFLDKRTAASAESFLRRSLEAIFGTRISKEGRLWTPKTWIAWRHP